MDESVDVHDLFTRATSGDTEAMFEWMRLQRSGRGLRLYPDGRRGPEDEGAIAFSFASHGEGTDRRWLMQAGRKVRIVEVPVEKAAAIADVILSQVGQTIIHAYAVDAAVVEGFVWLRMPEEHVRWEITDGQAASLAGAMLAVLRMSEVATPPETLP